MAVAASETREHAPRLPPHRRGHNRRGDCPVMFLAIVVALVGTIAALLWFTGWAEARVIEPKTRSPEAKLR